MAAEGNGVAVAGSVAAPSSVSSSTTTLIDTRGGPPVPAVAPADEGQPGRQSLANLLRSGDEIQPPQEGRVRFYKESKPRPPRKTAAQIIARLSWTTALLALAAIATARPMRTWSPAIAAVQHVGAAGLIAVAFLTAASVLTATGSSRRAQVLAPAMLGLCLGGAAVGLAIGLHFASAKPPAPTTVASTDTATTSPTDATPSPARRPTGVAAPSVTVSLSEATRAGRDAMDRLPGWYAAATSGHAVIRAGEYPASAPLSDELRANFIARPVLVLISINNSHGTKSLTVDPSTLRAEFPDGRRVAALAANDVIAASLADADNADGNARQSLVRADPGERAALALAFLPEGTDLHDAARLTVVMNGRRVALPGSYLSPQQKADLLHRAAALLN